MSDSSVIVLEFNELTPKLVLQWIGEGKLPGFKRLFDESIAYTTDAGEQPPNLEPWIQWVTVHTGLTYDQHGVFDLGDGHKLKAPRIWDIASDHGRRVWVCGSMNASMQNGRVNGAIVPDPWSTGFKPFPEQEFQDFFHFVRTNVQEYTRDKVPLSKGDYIRFVRFLLRNGLSAVTVRKTVAQLLSESGGKFKWRRAMILDRLMWDVFRAKWRALKPHYSTLFLNSVAHLQHFHWRNMDPAAFPIQPTAQEQAEYADAILRGYQSMDLIIQEALALVEGTPTSIVLMTALSQQPLLAYEESGGKQLYRAVDPMALKAFAGITAAAQFEPVMSEEFRFVFSTEGDAADAEHKLMALTCDGQAVMRIKRTGAELYGGCAIISKPGTQGAIQSTVTGGSKPFGELFYASLSVKSGGHHPDGIFWVRSPHAQPRVVAQRVPLPQTAPTLALLSGLPASVVQARFAPQPLAIA